MEQFPNFSNYMNKKMIYAIYTSYNLYTYAAIMGLFSSVYQRKEGKLSFLRILICG